MPTDPLIAEQLDEAARVLEALRRGDAVARLAAAADEIAGRFESGGKVLACGNGGSAADAMHFCEELTGRYRADRRALAAVACVDPGHLTCAANDYGYDRVFERWVEALGQRGDVLVVLSTSGSSANVVRAAESAGRLGLARLALLGRGGGELAGMCEHEIIAPGETSDRIQEAHMLLLHALVGAVERRLGLA